jgi:tetratricopeptide (TPR) repeat protein
VRAKAPDAPTGRSKRLIALGGLAVFLAVGLGSVLLGLWGDPMSWQQSNSLQGKTPPPAIAAIVAAPVAISNAPPPDVVSAPALATVPIPTRVAPAVAKRPATPYTPAVTARAATAPDPSQAKPVSPVGKESQSIVKSQSSGPSALELGYAALTQGRLREAEQAYRQALGGNSEERDALLGLAYIAHQQGRPDEARDYYKRVLRQEPGNPVAKSGLLTLSTTDDAQELGSRSREVAEQNPDSAAAQSVLGQSLARQGRLAEAQQAFYKAHLLEPGVALHAFNLAVALDRLRQYGSARQYYERAMVLSDKNGGERSSGVPISAVQARLEQLRAASTAPISINSPRPME